MGDGERGSEGETETGRQATPPFLYSAPSAPPSLPGTPRFISLHALRARASSLSTTRAARLTEETEDQPEHAHHEVVRQAREVLVADSVDHDGDVETDLVDREDPPSQRRHLPQQRRHLRGRFIRVPLDEVGHQLTVPCRRSDGFLPHEGELRRGRGGGRSGEWERREQRQVGDGQRRE